MGNPFKAIGHYFADLGKALFGQLKVTVANFLHQFAQEKLGALAIDAVEYASSLAPGGGPDALAAAKTKLLADLKEHGQDVTQFGESTLNFLIESALQKVKADAGKGFVNLGGTVPAQTDTQAPVSH